MYKELDDVSFGSFSLNLIHKHKRHYKKIQTTAVFGVLVWHSLIGVPVPNVLEELANVSPQLTASQERVIPEVLSQVPVAVPTPDQVSAPAQDIALPMRLQISRIGVNAPIYNVGLAADGSMAVPKDPFETGWYELGPRPGEVGSAVIAGHVDSPSGAPGVFADLDQLAVGDIITVESEGAPLTFRVREIRVYPADADATEIFTSTDGKAHLNLITCNGTWDKNTRQYTDRLVIFTDRI